MQKRNKLYIILLSLCSALFALPAAAQTVLLDPAEYYVGVTGGYGYSQYNFRPRITQGYLPVINGGVAFRYITENHVGLQIEAKYGQRGWSETGQLYKRRLDYIDVPLLTHLYWGHRSRFIFNVGPQFSYFLEDSVLADDFSAPDEDQHFEPVHYNFDYGIAVGLGYNLHLGRAGVYQLELRGYYGLGNIFPDKRVDYFASSNPLLVTLNAGYFIQLTGRDNYLKMKQELKEKKILKREEKQRRSEEKREKKLLEREQYKAEKNKKKKQGVNDENELPEELEEEEDAETPEESEETEVPVEQPEETE